MMNATDSFISSLQWVTQVNINRCKRWHGEESLSDWSGLEWAGAMCGEAGEAANVAKKMLRIEKSIANINANVADNDYEKLKQKLGKECADTFLYLNLLCARYDLDLGQFIKEVFNQKSEEYGFPEKL